VPLYFGLQLPRFLMDFNTLCINGKGINIPHYGLLI